MNRSSITLALSLSLSACAPSVRDLVANRHYREAVCAAYEANDPSITRTVSEGLLDDLGLKVHAQLVRAPLLDELQRARTPDRAVAMVRFDTQSDVLPLEDASIRASFGSERSLFVERAARGGIGVYPATIAGLAAVTGEELPRGHRVTTYITGANVLRGMAALATAGLSLLFSPMQSETFSVGPSDAEVRRAAPRATELAVHVQRTGCARIPQGAWRCRWYAIIDERADAELFVRLSMTYRADAPRRRETVCYLEGQARLSLGRVGDLSRTLPERFGQRAISLSAATRGGRFDFGGSIPARPR